MIHDLPYGSVNVVIRIHSKYMQNMMLRPNAMHLWHFQGIYLCIILSSAGVHEPVPELIKIHQEHDIRHKT